MTTDDKINLAVQRTEEILVTLGFSKATVTVNEKKPPAQIDVLLELLDCGLIFAKYAELDLEATRREREYFRNQDSNQG